MVCILAVTMSMSVFADFNPNERWGSYSYIKALANVGQYQYLNLEGNQLARPNRDVTLWTSTPSPDQRWKIAVLGGQYRVISNQVDTNGYNGYCLNIYRTTNNCDILDYRGNDKDSAVRIDGQARRFTVSLAFHNNLRLNHVNTMGNNPQKSSRNVYWGNGEAQWYKG